MVVSMPYLCFLYFWCEIQYCARHTSHKSFSTTLRDYVRYSHGIIKCFSHQPNKFNCSLANSDANCGSQRIHMAEKSGYVYNILLIGCIKRQSSSLEIAGDNSKSRTWDGIDFLVWVNLPLWSIYILTNCKLDWRIRFVIRNLHSTGDNGGIQNVLPHSGEFNVLISTKNIIYTRNCVLVILAGRGRGGGVKQRVCGNLNGCHAVRMKLDVINSVCHHKNHRITYG